jgi:hypothetical protein
MQPARGSIGMFTEIKWIEILKGTEQTLVAHVWSPEKNEVPWTPDE